MCNLCSAEISCVKKNTSGMLKVCAKIPQISTHATHNIKHATHNIEVFGNKIFSFPALAPMASRHRHSDEQKGAVHPGIAFGIGIGIGIGIAFGIGIGTQEVEYKIST